MSYPSRDWLKLGAAQDLAAQIENYWAARGKKVKARVDEFGCGLKGPVFAVRSDMINGAPRS
jgi:hypothetical protein